MHLEAAREPSLRGRDRGRGREHALPPERVDDQRRRQLAAVCLDRVAVATRDRRRLELELDLFGLASRLLAQEIAELAVVEGREAPGQLPARADPGRVDVKLVESLQLA